MSPKNIKVRAVKGRIVREEPRGPFIPSDRFVAVPETAYIRRLIDHHGDLEIEPKPAPVKPKMDMPVGIPETKKE